MRGLVAGPTFPSWSDAVIASLNDTAADLEDAGLDAGDVRAVAAIADRIERPSTRSPNRGRCTATCGPSTP